MKVGYQVAEFLMRSTVVKESGEHLRIKSREDMSTLTPPTRLKRLITYP